MLYLAAILSLGLSAYGFEERSLSIFKGRGGLAVSGLLLGLNMV